MAIVYLAFQRNLATTVFLSAFALGQPSFASEMSVHQQANVVYASDLKDLNPESVKQYKKFLLIMDTNKIDMADYKKIRELPNLIIEAVYDNFTDEDLAKLNGATNIRSLLLNLTKITNAGLKHLPTMKGLEALDISQTAITNDGLREVGKISTLIDLNLHHLDITDVEPLKKLKNLKRLNLEGTRLTDYAITMLKRSLSNTHVEFSEFSTEEPGKNPL